MSLIEIYNNTDNTHRQEMFYEYLKKSGLKESSYRQYAMTHPNNEAVRTVVKEVSKPLSFKTTMQRIQVKVAKNKDVAAPEIGTHFGSSFKRSNS